MSRFFNKKAMLDFLAHQLASMGVLYWDYEQFDGETGRPLRFSVFLIAGLFSAIVTWRIEYVFLGLIFHRVFDPQLVLPKAARQASLIVSTAIVCVLVFHLNRVNHSLPYGILLGIALSIPLERLRSSLSQRESVSSSKGTHFGSGQRKFEFFAMSMLAVLAKADGHISPTEIQSIEQFIRVELGYDDEGRSRAIEIFRQAKDGGFTFEYYANHFYLAFRREPAILVTMLDVLVRMAASDGELSIAERYHLETAVGLFGITEVYYQRILNTYGVSGSSDSSRTSHSGQKNSYQQQSQQKPIFEAPPKNAHYEVLGIAPEASDQEIKKAYRQLIKKYHPDRLGDRGLPKEFLATAKKRFLEVQAAYEAIRSERGFA